MLSFQLWASKLPFKADQLDVATFTLQMKKRLGSPGRNEEIRKDLNAQSDRISTTMILNNNWGEE